MRSCRAESYPRRCDVPSHFAHRWLSRSALSNLPKNEYPDVRMLGDSISFGKRRYCDE